MTQCPANPNPLDWMNLVPFGINIFKSNKGLQDEEAFYTKIRQRKLFGPTFDAKEFEGCQEIIKDCAKAEWPISWTAYALATAYRCAA